MMVMNRMQFQPGLSMMEFMQRYGTEAKCYRALHRACWPQGFCCPSCQGRQCSRFRRGQQRIYQCRACSQQSTLTSGTLFHASKLPLRTWMQAMTEREARRQLSGFVQIDDAYLRVELSGGKPGRGSPNKQAF